MNAIEEHKLRSLVADLVIDRFSMGDIGTFDGASADDFRHLIRAAYVVSDEAGHSLHRWVDAGRHAGLSWADVGDVLGVSRQAAQQRFSGTRSIEESPSRTPVDPSELIVRKGMNAFNEVAALEDEGRNGNELVGAAVLKLFFVPRARPWENARVTAFRGKAVIQEYEDAGWTYALTWYPFHYFTRPEIPDSKPEE
jgi:hypothetical protein